MMTPMQRHCADCGSLVLHAAKQTRYCDACASARRETRRTVRLVKPLSAACCDCRGEIPRKHGRLRCDACRAQKHRDDKRRYELAPLLAAIRGVS